MSTPRFTAYLRVIHDSTRLVVNDGPAPCMTIPIAGKLDDAGLGMLLAEARRLLGLALCPDTVEIEFQGRVVA